MFAVIFRATMKEMDEEYFSTAERLRDLALGSYGCTEFVSYSENNDEVAISYWQSKDQIAAWKDDPRHQAAQKIGAEKWYKSYKIQVVEILREYQSDTF